MPRQGSFRNTGAGDASKQEGGRWQDLLRNEVQQGQGSGVLAVRLHDDGLKVEEIETPSPDPGEVLVRVHAAAITWRAGVAGRSTAGHSVLRALGRCRRQR